MRDESDEDTRAWSLSLKRDAIAKVVINKLYKMTAMETSFAVNQLAIDGGRPKTLNLKEIINCYIEHRREVVMRRTLHDLKEAQRRAEQLEGYLIRAERSRPGDQDHPQFRRPARRRARAPPTVSTKREVETFGIREIHNEARLTNGRYRKSAPSR